MRPNYPLTGADATARKFKALEHDIRDLRYAVNRLGGAAGASAENLAVTVNALSNSVALAHLNTRSLPCWSSESEGVPARVTGVTETDNDGRLVFTSGQFQENFEVEFSPTVCTFHGFVLESGAQCWFAYREGGFWVYASEFCRVSWQINMRK